MDESEAISKLKESGHPQLRISADAAFKLHDTYGFPIDLTRIMAEERGMSVDIVGYEKLMEQAKELARSGGKGEKSLVTDLPPDAIAKLQGEKISPTNDSSKYKHGAITATVRAIWDGTRFVNEVPARSEGQDPATGSRFALILDHTNYYSEMGGQVGDEGHILGGGVGTAQGGGANFIVKNTYTIGGYVLHVGFNVAGPLRVDTTVDLHVSAQRSITEQNHTTTHVTNWALREVLGDGVQQKGSLVDPDKLRFDFSHGKSIADDEIEKIESLVTAAIRKNLPVYAEEAPQERALKINGLRAVFGEKYPPMVRVVSIGAPVKDLLADPANEKWRQFSIEFCGGTHLPSTGDAKAFALMSEESVSKGIRRITALTGPAASAAAQAASDTDALLAKAKSSPDDELAPIVTQLNTTIAAGSLPLRAKRRAQAGLLELQARVKAFEKAQKAASSNIDVAGVSDDLLSKAPAFGPGKLIVAEVTGASDEQLRNVMNTIAKKQPSYAIMLSAIDGEKVTFVAMVSEDLIKKGLKAGDWIRETAKIAGGGGGGKPNMAQAGGKDPSKLGEALEKAKAVAMGIAV
jgi:alanyl-tRNA synthetase